MTYLRLDVDGKRGIANTEAKHVGRKGAREMDERLLIDSHFDDGLGLWLSR